jgi:hypothetical protein
MEGEPTAEELYDQSFIEQPAILDKHKAAAKIVDGKYLLTTLVVLPVSYVPMLCLDIHNWDS